MFKERKGAISEENTEELDGSLRLVFLERSGLDQIWTFHEVFYNSDLRNDFWHNSIVIMYEFCWGSSKNPIFKDSRSVMFA